MIDLLSEVRMLALVSPVLGVVTSPYNLARIHPISKRKIPHLGTDFVAPIGADVRALTDGVVVATAKRTPGDTTTNGVLPGRSGSCVLVDHGDGLRSYYGHTAPHVGPGARVARGQVVGRSDGSGNITGPHLHLEVHVGGVAVDPEVWAEQRGLDIGITDSTDPQEADDMTKEEHDALVATQAQVAWIAQTLGHGGATTPFYTIRKQLEGIQAAVNADDVSDDDVRRIVAGVVSGLPASIIAQALDTAGVAKAVADELARRVAS